jgi:hypothetical protein
MRGVWRASAGGALGNSTCKCKCKCKWKCKCKYCRAYFLSGGQEEESAKMWARINPNRSLCSLR